MNRTLLGDFRWAVAVLAGVALGALVFDAGTAVVVGALAGIVVIVLVRAMLRLRRGTTDADA